MTNWSFSKDPNCMHEETKRVYLGTDWKTKFYGVQCKKCGAINSGPDLEPIELM